MSARSVKMDYAFCMESVLGENGFSRDELEQRVAPEVARLHQGLVEQHAQGKLGFMDLPHQPEQLGQVIEAAEDTRKVANNLVVLGIGGSALGATAVDMALKGFLRFAKPAAPGAMRLFVADNSDPRFFASILDQVPLQDTVFNVVSKSGTTAETMSQFLVVQQMLEAQLGAEEARRRLIFTTDPEKGVLRAIAKNEPVRILNVPPNVGGRFSVLSPVGLLPLACAGHDVKALLDGAAAMAQACTQDDLFANPAYMLAALAMGFQQRGRNVLVMMPYATDLFGLAQWFAQLWAESLGKANSLDGAKVHVGQTPAAAVGATDQHSQLQLYMEGPQDKVVMFLTVEDFGRDLTIPARYPDIDSLSYLGGKRMSQLISSEARATAAALASQGRPSLGLRLPSISAHTMGELIYLLELATVMAGAMLNIDPLDQPGVELSKKLTYGLMGRKGFEQQADELASLETGGRFMV